MDLVKILSAIESMNDIAFPRDSRFNKHDIVMKIALSTTTKLSCISPFKGYFKGRSFDNIKDLILIWTAWTRKFPPRIVLDPIQMLW